MSFPATYRTLNTQLGEFHVYAEGTITRALAEGQWWDDHLKPVLDQAHPGIAIDIGAHFGWFTRYLAQSHARVIACEPWPMSHQLLHENTWYLRNVQRWPVAAYDRPAVLTFADMNNCSDAGSFGFAPEQKGEQVPSYLRQVVGVRLDDYLPADGFPISLVKSDAQGADLQALRGMLQTLVRWRPLVVFEWEEGLAQLQRSTWEDYLKFFADLHYDVERITADYWDYVARPR